MIDQQVAPFSVDGPSTAINLRALTPFQRALLVTDGTVTKLIEAFTQEPLEIERLPTVPDVMPEHHPWLEVEDAATVAQRQVIIRGRYSRALYVYAVSLIVPDRLPSIVRRRLEVQGEGLGRLLNEAKCETRREVLWFAREHGSALPEPVRGSTDGEFITRVYRIISERRPVALITERFPCALGSLPSRE